MSADEGLALLTDQARGRIKPFLKIGSDGYVSFDKSSPEAIENLHLIKRIKVRSRQTHNGQAGDEVAEIELHDAQSALSLLGRHHKLFTDQTDMRVTGIHIEDFEEMLEKAYGDKYQG
jgi:hypothetical protein